MRHFDSVDSQTFPPEGPALTRTGLSRVDIARRVVTELGWATTPRGHVIDHQLKPLGHVAQVADAFDELGWIETSPVGIDGKLVDRYTSVRYDKFGVGDRDRNATKVRNATGF